MRAGRSTIWRSLLEQPRCTGAENCAWHAAFLEPGAPHNLSLALSLSLRGLRHTQTCRSIATSSAGTSSCGEVRLTPRESALRFSRSISASSVPTCIELSPSAQDSDVSPRATPSPPLGGSKKEAVETFRSTPSSLLPLATALRSPSVNASPDGPAARGCTELLPPRAGSCVRSVTVESPYWRATAMSMGTPDRGWLRARRKASSINASCSFMLTVRELGTWETASPNFAHRKNFARPP